jgi:hypothetical protein
VSNLRRINNGKSFWSDGEQSQRAAEANIIFVNNNLSAFQNKANRTDLIAFQSFKNMVNKKEKFTDKQKSYIDCMYEKTMAGLGLPSYKGQKSKYGVRFK